MRACFICAELSLLLYNMLMAITIKLCAWALRDLRRPNESTNALTACTSFYGCNLPAKSVLGTHNIRTSRNSLKAFYVFLIQSQVLISHYAETWLCLSLGTYNSTQGTYCQIFIIKKLLFKMLVYKNE